MHFHMCSLVGSLLVLILYCVLKGENVVLFMPVLHARDLKKYGLKIGCCVIGITWIPLIFFSDLMLANGKC